MTATRPPPRADRRTTDPGLLAAPDIDDTLVTRPDGEWPGGHRTLSHQGGTA